MKKRATPEHDLQKAVAEMLPLWLKPPTYWTAIDHAAQLSPRYGAQRKARGVKRGIGDLFIMHPAERGTLVLFIELKAKTGTLTEEQREFAQACLACNVWCILCRSVEEVEKALRFCKVPLHASVTAKAAA